MLLYLNGFLFRQWLVKRFHLWEGELDWLNQFINQDIFNNSAWNYRYTLMKQTGLGVREEIK
jgi:protein farnesyltransferase/geranylgeranyltransferase type-1 subunit alpha